MDVFLIMINHHLKHLDVATRRLILLENGVRNYGGGIDKLYEEVTACCKNINYQNTEEERILKIVKGYLSGLIEILNDEYITSR